ncbi:MAG TPA: 30S ribosomal protein S3 [Anaerolineales bacterium]|nr:30S ribosomal protein S3 [Anaerolineales bacterium]
MGRKVHPIGFRLKINKDWLGRWYAEGEKYTRQLHEDFTIRRMILSGNDKASISKIDIERFPNLAHVTIHTAKPGIVIGRKGAQVKVLRTDLEKLCGTKVKVDVNEITVPDIDAKLVADNIAGQLERRISHSRAMKRAVSQALRAGAKGVKIMCSGRLSGSEMARREWQREGRVPLQTLRADIDFAKSEALTTFGRIGVKVWIYKGEVLKEEEPEATDVYVSE